MTTKTEVLKAIADIERTHGLISPMSSRPLGVPESLLFTLVEAAKHARYSNGKSHSEMQLDTEPQHQLVGEYRLLLRVDGDTIAAELE